MRSRKTSMQTVKVQATIPRGLAYSGEKVSKTYSLTLNNPFYVKPTLSTEGGTTTFLIQAVGGVSGAPFTYDGTGSGALPGLDGMSFNKNTGVIQGTPTKVFVIQNGELTTQHFRVAGRNALGTTNIVDVYLSAKDNALSFNPAKTPVPRRNALP